MTIQNSLKAMALSAVVLGPVGAASAAEPMKLTAMDYIEIEQLNSKYAFFIENCTNKGYDYADLYTADGEFGVSKEWGQPGKIYAKGRDALAKAAGGGPDGCVDPKTQLGYGITHVIVDVVITPTATGATGKSILLALGVGGNPTTIERQGGYEDVYVKTKDGWRMKTRYHVFPNIENSVQFGKKK
ncbi:MAG: nuclear transport factor 2 family protein [Gammaproteobacteria bacterium]